VVPLWYEKSARWPIVSEVELKLIRLTEDHRILSPPCSRTEADTAASTVSESDG